MSEVTQVSCLFDLISGCNTAVVLGELDPAWHALVGEVRGEGTVLFVPGVFGKELLKERDNGLATRKTPVPA